MATAWAALDGRFDRVPSLMLATLNVLEQGRSNNKQHLEHDHGEQHVPPHQTP
jgi:hypothetical protein